MRQPLISIVIPTYNRAHIIGECLDSIFKQTFKNYEIVIIDDGSSDSTEDVINKYPQEKIIYKKITNSGVSVARNTGIDIASGEYVAFLDSDDLWDDQKLQLQVAEILKNEFTSMITTSGRTFGKNRREIIGNGPFLKKSGYIYKWLFIRNFIITSSVIVKRSILKEIGCFSTDKNYKIGEDLDLWLRITKKYHVTFIPIPLVKYRYHAENTCQDYLDSLEHTEVVIKNHLETSDLSTIFKKKVLAFMKIKKFRAIYKNNYKRARDYLYEAIKLDPVSIFPRALLLFQFCRHIFVK